MENTVKNFTKITFIIWKTNAQFSKVWHNKNTQFIPEELLLQYKSLYEQFKTNNIKNNTKVYSTQLSELPSYKLKNYVEENKLNITYGRKWSEIDSVIIGYNFISQYYGVNKINSYIVVPTAHMKKAYSNYMPSNNNRWEKIETEYCLIDMEDYTNKMLPHDSSFSTLLQQFPVFNGNIIDSSHGNSKAYKQYDFFSKLPDLIKKHNFEIVFDETLSGEVNKGVIIDEEIFSNLLNMINSEDMENLNMVREIMANSEYEASEPYLAYLFNTHNKLRIINGNGNYKYLLNKLKKYRVYSIYDSPSVDEILSGLIKIEPKFATEYTKCIKTHINHKLKKDIIKEIILN